MAGAYLATVDALHRLYPGEVPERGAIRVEVRGKVDEGVAGVVAAVAGLITGAAAEGGFKGIAGRFERRGLLRFEAPISAELRFTRLDTGASVEVNLPAATPMSPELLQSLRRSLASGATTQERQQFAAGWQARVERMLT